MGGRVVADGEAEDDGGEANQRWVRVHVVYLPGGASPYLSIYLSLYCLATDDDDDDDDDDTDDNDTDAMCRRGSDIQGQQAGGGIAPR